MLVWYMKNEFRAAAPFLLALLLKRVGVDQSEQTGFSGGGGSKETGAKTERVR